MNLEPKQIFEEYKSCYNFKNSVGSKGIYEQSKINERFYNGDQWYGANCGNDRPLVRHNIIKRIGEYKMSQIATDSLEVSYGADGVSQAASTAKGTKKRLEKLKKVSGFKGELSEDETNTILTALDNYYGVTARRMGFERLCGRALKNAYISGTGIVYTYWDPEIKTGIYSGIDRSTEITGDIKSEVLRVEDVYFADSYSEDVQTQPFIIISCLSDVNAVRREAEKYGADQFALRNIVPDDNGKVQLLTKLYKDYNEKGEITVRCVKVTEKVTVRHSFDTRLRLYPLAVFRWEERNNLMYGDTEVTYLIPNQIAINRMTTANVWASVTMGMPIMVVNGDTVTDDVTNEPGQIIKIYGSNEDVAGAVKYVAPPDCCRDFGSGIDDLIKNTLIQSGANEVALGDSRPDNASALQNMYDAATYPLKLIKNRYHYFIEEIAGIWADFWITQYGIRKIKLVLDSGCWYMPFDASRYRNLYITAQAQSKEDEDYSDAQKLELLATLYDKGIIDGRRYVELLPEKISEEIDLATDETEEVK